MTAEVRAARDPPALQSASGARERARAGCRPALPPPSPPRLYRGRPAGSTMARSAFTAAPLLAWTALALSCAVDACPGGESTIIRSCTSRNECTANVSSTLALAPLATVSASCQWIVLMADDVYVVDEWVPFYLTEDGGCSQYLQMGSDGGGSLSALSPACSSYTQRSSYLFFRSGSIIAIQPTPLLLERFNAKRHTLIKMSFKAGKAVNLCEEAELEINQTTFVRTPFLAVSTTPCVTTLKAGSGRALSITVIDIWPNPAPSVCACYERLTAEPGTVTCWSQPSDFPIVDRRVNVTLNAAGSECTIVLLAQVIGGPDELVTAAETQSVPSAPGVYVLPNGNLIIAISVTTGGGIVIILCVAAVLVVCHKRGINRHWKARLDRGLVPQSRLDGRSSQVAEEPVYFELEDSLTYRGHLIRREPVACPKASTATDTEPGVKLRLTLTEAASSQATASGSSATNDYEEIGPFITCNSAGR